MLITTEEFIAKIDRFLKETRMTEGEFGRACCNNSHFLPRLRYGLQHGSGGVKLDKVHHVLNWIDGERLRRREAKRAAREARAAQKAVDVLDARWRSTKRTVGE